VTRKDGKEEKQRIRRPYQRQPLLKAGDKWSAINVKLFCELLKEGFEGSGNPIYAWGAMRMCVGAGKPIPSWVIKYFAQCADRMISEWDTSDLQAVLPRILGFPKKGPGPGKPLQPGPGEDKAAFTRKFLNYILEGKDPKTARADACNEVFSCAFADKVTDKTLVGYLLETLRLQEAPPKNAQEWKAVAYRRAMGDLFLIANPTEADRERVRLLAKEIKSFLSG
jgi:hypothetical protein